MNRIVLILIVLLICSQELIGQWIYNQDQLVFSFGIRSQLGTHQTSVGLFSRITYSKSSICIKSEWGLDYFLNDLGPNINHRQFNLQNSIFYQYGNRVDDTAELWSNENILDDGVSNNAIGYSLNWYLNNIGTSQTVGSIMFRFNHLVFLFQNDLLGNLDGKDRFRTGSFAIAYFQGAHLISMDILTWTGETRCKDMVRIKDSSYPAKNGYKDISGCKYANVSHGILKLHYNYYYSHNSKLGVSIGVDDERIRNLTQNKIVHDAPMIPPSLIKSKNLHIPMLDIEGHQYLYKKEQSIKPIKFYGLFSYNQSNWY